MHETISPRPDYTCLFCEQTHCLGENDCDGLPIGWIEKDGTPFVSRQERDIILGAAALREELIFWGKTGGLLGDISDPERILTSQLVLPEHFEDALEEFNKDVGLLASLWQERASQAVANN